MSECNQERFDNSKHQRLIFIASLLGVIFSLSVCAGDGQQLTASQSDSRFVKPSVSGTRVIPQALTASKQIPGGEPEFATDGDGITLWNAGDFAPQWIQFDLGEPTAVSEVLLN